MTESVRNPLLQRIVGAFLLVVGVAVFLIRLQHDGPYGFPRGGNLVGAVLALVLGGWLSRPWLGAHPLARPLAWAALVASPVVLFFALYSTLAELEEVVVLKAADRAGRATDLRLWVVDTGGEAWVTMPRSKAVEYGLDGAQLELLRAGELGCVVPRLDGQRAQVQAIHSLRHEKYAVQRLATVVGLFGREPGAETVALRLDACPG